MKKIIAFVVCALIAAFAVNPHVFSSLRAPAAVSAPAPASGSGLEAAIDARAENVQVQGSGTVVKILSDDTDGSRHQRFIVRLPSGHTVLIAHNIDLAGRVAPLNEGDAIDFSGEYLWNPKGGVVHWTHHDPDGRHQSGWIRHDGRTVQ